MKKRIIAFALALVMVIAMLVGCGAPSIEEYNLDDYATFNIEDFIKDLAKIEIEDGTYTNNPVFRELIVKESVYSSVASGIVKNGEKLYEGKIGANDVVYFAYYLTDADGTIFYYDQMDPSSITASNTSSAHVLQLGAVSENDKDYEFTKKLLDALLSKDVKDNIYKVNNTKNTEVKIEDDDDEITIVISYNRNYTDKGELADDASDDKVIKEVAAYEMITLSKDLAKDNAFIAALIAEGSVVKVGNKVTVKKEVVDDKGTPDDTSDDTKSTTDSATFDVVINGVTYTYDSVQVKWIVDEIGNPDFIKFNHTPFKTDESKDEEQKEEKTPSGLCVDGTTVNLIDKELTYHIFPVYYYDVPEFVNDAGEADDNIIAAAIIKYILADKVDSTSMDILGNEDYKLVTGKDDAGNDISYSVKELADQLKEIYSLKSSKKWADASDKLKTYAYIILLDKINSGKYDISEYTEAEQALVGDYNKALNILNSIAKISLMDKISSTDANSSTLTDEEKTALTAVFTYLKDNASTGLTDELFTISSETINKFFELKEDVEVTRPAALKKLAEDIEAKNAEIKALEDKIAAAGDAALAADKEALAALKTELESLKKEESGAKTALTNKILEYKTAGLELLSTAKTDAYNELVKIAIDSKIDEIIKSSKTADEKTTYVAGELVKEKYEQLRHDMDAEYRKDISTKVAKEVYKLIGKYVTVVKYPEEIVKEFSDHIYEEYEYKFYKEKRANTDESNYKYFRGDLEAYLKDAFSADDYMSAIEKKAKEYLDPMIKIYVVAKAFDARGAQAEFAQFVEADILAGVYDAHYVEDEELSAEENAEAKAEAEETAKENKDYVREDAKYFFINDEAFDAFKDSQGSSYSDLVEMYGERNIRAALQVSKLLDYLVGTQYDVTEHDGEWHTEAKCELVEDADGNKFYKIIFHNSLVQYTIKK